MSEKMMARGVRRNVLRAYSQRMRLIVPKMTVKLTNSEIRDDFWRCGSPLNRRGTSPRYEIM
jgi:hypothetical protein